MAIWRKLVLFTVILINSIAVDETYEWLAPLCNSALNLYPPMLMTTTGWITLESPIKFASYLVLVFLSCHISKCGAFHRKFCKYFCSYSRWLGVWHLCNWSTSAYRQVFYSFLQCFGRYHSSLPYMLFATTIKTRPWARPRLVSGFFLLARNALDWSRRKFELFDFVSFEVGL